MASFSGPTLAGNKVIYGSDRFGVRALAKQNGQLLWKKNLKAVHVVPLVVGQRVFVGSALGDFYSLQLDSGEVNWQVNLGAAAKGEILSAFDRLFVATADEAVHALDPATGKILWTYRRSAFSGTSVTGGGSPAAIGGQVWAGFSDGNLVAINPQTGAMESERIYRDNTKFMDLDARVVGWKDGLLVNTYDGKLRYTRKDGTLIWEFGAGGAKAPLVTSEGILFLPSSDGNVYAISGSAGKEIWRSSLRRGVPTSVALAQKGKKEYLVVGSSEEKIYLLDPATGKQLTQVSFGKGSGSYSPIAVDGDKFFVLSSYSRLYQFILQ